MQQTSWDGVQTRRLKPKGAYTRYSNRRAKTGLQVVKNRKYYNEIYSPSGKFLGYEAKYHSPNSYDHTAKVIYNKQIKPNISKKLQSKYIS